MELVGGCSIISGNQEARSLAESEGGGGGWQFEEGGGNKKSLSWRVGKQVG